MFEDEHLLITGGTGFVGSHVIKKLEKIKNIEITVLSRNKMGLKKNINYLKCDLTNRRSVQSNFKEIEDLDRILHLSSLNPQTKQEDIYKNVSQNLLSSINLLENTPDDIKNFVFSSTIDVYGTPVSNPIKESHPTEPLTYYGACKLSAEKFLKIGLAKLNVPLTILRYSQIYGPGEPIIKAIPSFIQKIKNNESPVIYGEGNDIRDYVYIDDIVTATQLALSKEIVGIFNIGTGKGHTIKEVLNWIIHIYGKNIEIKYKPSIKKQFSSVYDINKANEILGYYPNFEMRNGLEKMINSI